MRNITKRQKENLPFWIGLLLSLSLLWPLAHKGYFTHHDDVQVIRLNQMDKCIKDFQIPCRWVPDLGGEYGYPLFNYYPPLPYYIGEIFYLLVQNYITAAKLMFATSFILSYFFMYKLGERLWGKWGGGLSAIFYSFVPYHAINMYVRGAMGELWAFAFFPLIFYFLLILFEKPNIRNAVRLGLSIALLVLSHNISAMIFLPFVILFAVIYCLKIKKRHLPLLIFLSLAFALLLSAFYWIPAVLEKGYVHVETMTVGYFSYTEHFKGLRKLFMDRSWGWGPSIREVPGGELDQMPYQIGIVHVLIFLVSLILVIGSYLKKRKYTIEILVVGICFCAISVAIFMIHPRSLFVWEYFDSLLKYLQFPWRFLIIVAFFISLGSGAVFSFVKKGSEIIWVVLVLLAVILNFSYFRPENFIDTTQSLYLSGDNLKRQINRSIFDYLPIFAKFPPAQISTQDYRVSEGECDIQSFSKGSDWILLKVESQSGCKIILSQYYFPGWEVYINKNSVDIDYANELGLMTVNLPTGQSLLRARLKNTPVRTASNILTVVSIGFLVYIIKRKNV